MELGYRQIAKAQRFLRTARLAYDDGDNESCVSRAYYALFHSVSSLLEARGGIVRRRWNHIELQRIFAEQFCNRGYLSFNKRDSDTLRDLYAERLRGDYELGPLNSIRTQRFLIRAQSLLRKIQGVINSG